jgi:uncharacterized membrane protein
MRGGEIMPECPGCGRQLTGTVEHCPACGRPTNFAAPPTRHSPFRSLQSLPLGDYFKTGWELFKQYPGGFIGFFLVYMVIALILHLIPLWGWLLFFAVSPALIMGNFIVSAKLLQRQPPQFRDFFAGFHFFLPLLLLSLVTSILIAIGLALLIIPGIYLAVAYLFSSCLVIDRRLDFWPAMELSRRTVNPLWFGIFTFMVLLVAINMVGALLLGLGLLVTVPLTYCALTAAYADLFGFQSDYAQEVPRLNTL